MQLSSKDIVEEKINDNILKDKNYLNIYNISPHYHKLQCHQKLTLSDRRVGVSVPAWGWGHISELRSESIISNSIQR